MESVTAPPAAAGRPVPAPPAPPAPARIEPTRVKVTGPLHAVRFPDACAACGAPARGALRVEKMFRRTSDDSPTRYLFAALDVPFCDDCRARHAGELTPVDPAVLRRLRWGFVVRCLPYVIPIGVLLWIIPQVILPMAREFLREGTPGWGTLIGVGIVAFFGVSLASFVHLVNQARKDLTAPYAGDPNDTYVRRERVLLGRNAVIPGAPTSVLAAANFTDDQSELFEPERRTFTFRDPVFAAQFAALNADRLWDAKAPRARRARWLRKAALYAVVAAGAAIWLLDWWQG